MRVVLSQQGRTGDAVPGRERSAAKPATGALPDAVAGAPAQPAAASAAAVLSRETLLFPVACIIVAALVSIGALSVGFGGSTGGGGISTGTTTGTTGAA